MKNVIVWLAIILSTCGDLYAESYDDCMIRLMKGQPGEMFNIISRKCLEDDKVEPIKSSELTYDKKTNLMWQDNDYQIKHDWDAAIRYCNNLILGGYSDWRLPDASALADLKNRKEILESFLPSSYWSSTSPSTNTNLVWNVYFDNGIIGSDFKNGNHYVRCVRGLKGTKIYANQKKISYTIPDNMALIPSGEFQMGNNDGEKNEKPMHSVYLDAYTIDKYEVTVSAYRKCVNAGKCSKPETGRYHNWDKSDRKNHPINGVNWNDAKTYCQYAGKRLPTEAEWEKAATWKDGQKYKYPSGKNSVSCDDAVMVNNNANWQTKGGCERVSTWAVGSKPQEINGTYDMAGNVWEWVADWYGEYSSGTQLNPTGPAWGGSSRVIRGGCWSWSSSDLRGALRYSYVPSFRGLGSGFRCASSR